MTAEAELKKFHIFKYYICAFHVYATYVDDKVQNLIDNEVGVKVHFKTLRVSREFLVYQEREKNMEGGWCWRLLWKVGMGGCPGGYCYLTILVTSKILSALFSFLSQGIFFFVI